MPAWELSGWWRRVGALVIDTILLSIVAGLIGVVAALVTASGFTRSDGELSGAFVLPLVVSAILVVPTIYYCWMMPATNGQTVGKQALGIRVVREDGGPITAGFAFMRQILVINIFFGLVLGFFLFGLPQLIDYLWPLWDSKNQALHDKAVKSRVVLASQVPPPVIDERSLQPYFEPTATPQQPFPQAPPAPPQPGGASTPYTPPPGFENPVPDDDKR